MISDDFFYLGKITKLFGTKGDVVAFLDTDNPENYMALESVFLSMEGELIPFFIESMSPRKGNTAAIHFAETDNTEKASWFINRELYLPIELLPKLSGTRFYYHEITDFEVIDTQHGNIGKVKEVLDYPRQAIISILHEDKEILIPVSDDIITAVDRENKILHIDAPEGLIDIYLD